MDSQMVAPMGLWMDCSMGLRMEKRLDDLMQ
jgi:hypothetical protein